MVSEAPLEFFRGELLNDNLTPAERVTNVRRTRLVAAAVGVEVARTDLIAILRESQEQFVEEDEYLYALAEELASLCNFLGGEEHFKRVVPQLEALATVEETVVREKAVESILNIIGKFGPTTRPTFVQSHFFPVVEKLSKGGWFTSRVSACGLFAAVYNYVSEAQRGELRKFYCALCHDDTPMVRRAAAANLKNFFSVVDKAEILNCFVTPSNGIYHSFWNDASDSIRSSVLIATLELARKSSSEENRLHTAEHIRLASEDRSWRVRLTMAKICTQFVEAYGRQLASQCLMTSVADLLLDPEQEVRTSMLTQIANNVNILSPEQLEIHIIPTFDTLALDSSQPVRAALATAVGKIAVAVGKELTEKYLLQLILELLKDEYCDVRLNIVANAGEICDVLGCHTLARSVLISLQSLMYDLQWRIRLSVVKQIPLLAKHFGAEMFQAKMEPMFMAALTDSVYAVRECAMESTKTLTELFGTEWALELLLPKILENGTGSTDAFFAFQRVPKDVTGEPLPRPVLSNVGGRPVSYLSRITVLRTLLHLATASVVSCQQVEEFVLPHITMAMKDEVANVRFAAAKITSSLVEKRRLGLLAVEQKIRPSLERLLDDDDLDVQYFANEALRQVEAMMSS